MGYTIVVIRRKDAKKILECKDANAVIPVDECTYDKGVLLSSQCHNIGYVGSQYDELNRALGPLLQKYDCVIYNCDWGTISLPEHSFKVRMFRLKYRLKTNKWAIALRDTLLLFLLFEVGFLLIRSASSHIDNPLIDFSSVSFATGTIGAAVFSSVRIWAEVILHFKSKR